MVTTTDENIQKPQVQSEETVRCQFCWRYISTGSVSEAKELVTEDLYDIDLKEMIDKQVFDSLFNKIARMSILL